jgi:hypothetical protein
MQPWRNYTDGENQRTWTKNYPCAILTINPIWTNPDMNLGLHGERPATNCLSHGTAYRCMELKK